MSDKSRGDSMNSANPAAGAAGSGAAAGSTGEIFDLGYQSYTGPRLGRSAALRALTIQSIRTAFGIGRSARAKVVPIGLLILATLPAAISITVAAATGNQFQLTPHERYFTVTSWYFAVLCAAQAPELVGGDQQYRVLSLYFARALRRSDYVIARVTALATALLSIALIPQLVLFFGRAFVNANPWSMITQDAHLLAPIVASCVLVSVLFATISILIASVTKRRLLATVAIIATLMLTTAVASVLVRGSAGSMKYAVLASPMLVGEAVTMWLFQKPVHPRSALGRADLPGTLYLTLTLGVSAAAILLLTLRYKRIQA